MSLGAGIIPSLNIAGGLLAFCTIRAWHTVMGWTIGSGEPFTAQECNVVQTFVTAASSVAFTVGFGTYLTAMDKTSYRGLAEQNLLKLKHEMASHSIFCSFCLMRAVLGEGTPGNREQDTHEPSLSMVCGQINRIIYVL